MITYNSADIIFGHTNCRPDGVFARHLEAYTDSGDPSRRQELRLLMTTAKVFVRYRSQQVETVVRLLCSRFLDRIYQDRFEVEFKELSFLLTLVWHYRTVEKEQDMVDFDKATDFYKQFGYLLFERGVTKGYQGCLF